jgi:hypothetical protein
MPGRKPAGFPNNCTTFSRKQALGEQGCLSSLYGEIF